jgi:hypothetical protein
MPSSEVKEFCKTAHCPSSETLLRYRRYRMPIAERAGIEIHLRSCDFCSAELQLLMRHRVALDRSSCAKLPVNLRQLAERLLARNGSAFTPLKDLTNGKQVSH